MTDDLVKRLKRLSIEITDREKHPYRWSDEFIAMKVNKAASCIEELKEQRDYFHQQYVRKCEHEFEVRRRIEQLESALCLIGEKDEELDEPALWIDDNTPLGLFIDMTLGEKKDGN
jgi:hypothetical protein